MNYSPKQYKLEPNSTNFLQNQKKIFFLLFLIVELTFFSTLASIPYASSNLELTVPTPLPPLRVRNAYLISNFFVQYLYVFNLYIFYFSMQAVVARGPHTRTWGQDIRGRHTDLVITKYTNRSLVVLTQLRFVAHGL